MKMIKKGLLFLLGVLVIAQFFRPNNNVGDVISVDAFMAETNPPEAVRAILKDTCINCHSNVTTYPWYSYITPVNYWMASHINKGKKHFNMSNWVANSAKRKDTRFKALIKLVKNKDMPLKAYALGHAQAKLTVKQIEAVTHWAQFVRLKYSMEPLPQ